MAGKRHSGLRVVAAGVFAVAGIGGAGVLTAAFTVDAARPPQPSADQQARLPLGSGELPRSIPLQVDIPAIGVRADVIPVGVAATNELEVPSLETPMLTGWYKLGVSPGERGNAVIVGHVDAEKVGPAVFFNLGRLQPGDTVNVARVDGSVAVFKVDFVKSFLKADFPADLVYATGESAGLRLVTCGGQYDRKNRNYLSNVVVFATLYG